MSELSYVAALVLGVVEGLTEFLPVSSTGHLTVTEKLLGLSVDAPAVTAYTAIIQLGAIAATLIYFAKDIARLLAAWVAGLRSAEAKKNPDYSLAWVRDRPGVASALVGARTTAQLKEALDAEDVRLPAQIVTALEDVSSTRA